VPQKNKPYKIFGELLTQGITRLAANRHQSIGPMQEQLAEKLGVSSGTIFGWRRGERLPDHVIMAKLARIFMRELNTDEVWVEQFLRTGGYGFPESIKILMQELFRNQVHYAEIDQALTSSPVSDNIPPIDFGDVTTVTIPYTPGAAPPPPTLLIGREGDIATLYRQITGTESMTLLTAVRGWPGVGKTSLAAALAHDSRIIAAFPDGVLWTALGQEPSVMFSLGEWMTALGDDPGRYPTLEGRRHRLAAMLRYRRMLLIVDDVWDAAHVEPFRIGGSDCRILITTRYPEVAGNLGLPEKAIYLLPILPENDRWSFCNNLPQKR
jgi:transcriptional regulator with XRE-family HTH domain